MTMPDAYWRPFGKKGEDEMEQIPWQAIRERYERGGISYMGLSKAFGVPASVIGKRAKREDWGGDRKRHNGKKSHGDLYEVADRLVAIVSDMVAEGREQMDVKTLKELTAVLRELNNLSKNRVEAKSDCPIVRVVVEGDAEEWSQ